MKQMAEATRKSMTYMRRHPGEAIHIGDVADATGLTKDQVSNALQNLKRTPVHDIHPTGIRGWYVYAPNGAAVPLDLPHGGESRPTAEVAIPSKAELNALYGKANEHSREWVSAYPKMYEFLGKITDTKVLIRDLDETLLVAIPLVEFLADA
jgi:hypothetical protein